MKNLKIQYKVVLMLVALIIFHFVNNYLWLKSDSISLHKDVIFHLDHQLTFFYGLKARLSSGLGFFGMVNSIRDLIVVLSDRIQYWPPVYYFLSSWLALFFGNTLLSVRLFPNMLYFIILIFSVYLLGKKLADRQCGIISAILVSFYPGILGSSRIYGLDFPLAAMSALTILLLMYTDNFNKRIVSMVFGLILGIGILTKIQILFFISGPLVYIICKALFQGLPIAKRGKIINIIIAAAATLSISGWWLIKHFKFLLHLNLAAKNKIMPFIVQPSFLETTTFYINTIISNITLIPFAIFVISLIGIIISRLKKQGEFKDIFILFLWISVPYFILTFISFKNDLYFMPAFPSVALITVLGIKLFNKTIKRIFFIFLILILFSNYFLISCCRLSYNIFWNKLFSWDIFSYNLAHPPIISNQQEIIKGFMDIINKSQNNKPLEIGIIDEQYFHSDSVKELEYFLRLSDPKLKIYRSTNSNWVPYLNNSFFHAIDNFDYIIAFSRNYYNIRPDFQGVKYFKIPSMEQGYGPSFDIETAIQKLNSYRVIKKDFIMSPPISIYLLVKGENSTNMENADDYHEAIKDNIIGHVENKLNFLIGEIVSLDSSNSKLWIRYLDDNKILKEDVFYVFQGVTSTSYRNIFSIKDVKPKDVVMAEYYIDKKNRKILKSIEADRLSEARIQIRSFKLKYGNK